MLPESSDNEHQTLRELAKSTHGVNEGSTTAVYRYPMSEIGLSIALEMVRSPKLTRLPHRTAEELASRWLGMQGGLGQDQARQNDSESSLEHVVPLRTWKRFWNVLSLKFSCQCKQNFTRDARPSFGASGMSGLQKGTWKCGYGVRDPLSAGQNSCSSTVIKLTRMPIFTQEHPSSREHTVF